MLVLHVSDTHIGSSAPRALPFRYRDVLEAFAETIDIAIREHVDLYLHAGDFFDKAYAPPDAYLVAFKQLKRLRDSGIRTVVVAGQHDIPKRYGISPLLLLKELGVVDYVAISSVEKFVVRTKSGELSITAVPYPKRREISKAVAPRNGKPSVLVAHLLLKEVVPQNPDASLESIPRGFNYVALGDFHGYRVFRLSDGTPVVYPGATEVFRRDEWSEDGKGVVLVDLSKPMPRVERVRLSSVRPWIVDSFDSVQVAMEKILEKLSHYESIGAKKPLVFISLRSDKRGVLELQRFLEKLRDLDRVSYFHVEALGRDEVRELSSPELAVEESEEKLDIFELITKVVESKKLAELIYELATDPSEAKARKLYEELKNDPNLLEEAKRFVLRGSLTTMVHRAKELSSSGASRSLPRRGGGLMSFLRR